MVQILILTPMGISVLRFTSFKYPPTVMNRSVKRPSQTSLVTSESINILGVFKAPAAITTILE